jgi:3-phenylpropionate/cinnamic acid dioxygenase small subunit
MDLDERQAIEQECIRLINLYAVLNDANDWDRLAELYTEDARFARPSAPHDFVTGRENILAALKARPPRKSRHVVSNIVIDVEGPATARAFSVILLFQGEEAEDGGLPILAHTPPLVGHFHDKLALTPGGWRFAERQGGLDFRP